MRSLPDRVVEALADDGRDLSILVVRLGALGDIVRTLPAVRLIRFALPDARIFWAADERWTPLLVRHPELDGTIALPRARIARSARSPLAWLSLFREVLAFRRVLREPAPALALDFHGGLRSGAVALLSGAAVRLGYSGHQQREGNRWLTTHRVASGPRRISRMERNLSLVRALGLPVEPLPDAGIPRTISGTRGARGIVRRLAPRGGRIAVLAPGASARQAYKKPPADLLAAAAATLSERGIAPVVVWGPGEESDARAVVGLARGDAHLGPPTDLATLIALLREATLCVSGDTGPLHLACGLGCPVVGIYGPTDPAVNAPWGVPHAIVSPPDRSYTGIKRVDRRAGGFEGIRSADVIAATSRVLDAPRDHLSDSDPPPASLESPGQPVRRE